MSTAPKIMALQEIEPPTALAEALTPEFLRPLRIENPPPVRLARRPEGATWGGYCQGLEYTENREVVLDDYCHPPEKWLVEERFRGTYLHEITHRFLSKYQEKEIGGDHGPVFFSLQLLLFLRAGERAEGDRRPWFLRAGVYDLQDAWLAENYTPGQALDWACCQAEELSGTEISAELAAGEIALRFACWKKTLAEAPARRAAVAAARAQQRTALRQAEDKVLWWRLYCGGASFTAAVFLFWAIRA